MSADADTFDIDIYGDEAQDEQNAQTEGNGSGGSVTGEDEDYDYGNDDTGGAHNTADNNANDPAPNRPQAQEHAQGTKRKAPSDESESHQRPPSQVDPGATAALKLTDLHWWTTEEDLRAFCTAAQSELSLVDVAFGEHKINGKSRGEAYLEFDSPAAASAVKNEIEKKESGNASNGEAKRINPFHIYFTVVGNPFKGRDSGAVGKKEYNNNGMGRGGAYNNTYSNNNNNNNRGGFGGRGGGFNRGGGGFNRGGGYMNNNPAGGNNNNNSNMMSNQQWNMGNGGMGMGFGGNPMMAMAGYGNMGRGSMGGMMGRGAFGGMGNMGGNMMGMGGRGGGGMMMGGGRGGWGGGAMMGGGMQPGYGAGNFGGGMGAQQGGQGHQQQNQANKRMKAE